MHVLAGSYILSSVARTIFITVPYCGNGRDLVRRKFFRLQWTNTEAKKTCSRTS